MEWGISIIRPIVTPTLKSLCQQGPESPSIVALTTLGRHMTSPPHQTLQKIFIYDILSISAPSTVATGHKDVAPALYMLSGT